MRKAEVYYENRAAGVLTEDDEGYRFKYHEEYMDLPEAIAVSLTLPLQEDEYFSLKLFPFFDGLIPEGWLLSIAERNWKLNSLDRMGLLVACCRDCIGASIRRGKAAKVDICKPVGRIYPQTSGGIIF